MRKYKNKLNNMDYLVYLPNEFEENMPLLLFLHGIGERGDNVDDIERFGFTKYMKELDIPYLVVAPQCKDNNFWSYHLRDVEQILEEVHIKYNYDRERVCILGCSMGGFGAWNYIMQRPNIFKGIISVAAGAMLPIKSNLELIKDKAILLYHGDKDDIIEVEESINLYDKLNKICASNVELKVIKDDNHFLSTHAFEDSYLYEWLDKNIRNK